MPKNQLEAYLNIPKLKIDTHERGGSMFMYHWDTSHIGQGNMYHKGWKGKVCETAGEVADLASKYVCSPCLWASGIRLKANFRLADWIGLDFDDGLSLEDAIKLFEPYLHIIGTTKSHQVEKSGKIADRFRVFLKLTDKITHKEDYETTVSKFIDDHGADKACKDAGRFFWPCKDIIVCKYWGKTVEPIKYQKEKQERTKKYLKKQSARLNAYFKPGKVIPPKARMMLDHGVADGSRSVACWQVAKDMKKVGYSEGEALEIIWNSPIPQDSSNECFAKVKSQVRIAFSQA